MKKITFISIFALILFANNCYCQDGSLDTSFGTDGKVITPIGTTIDIGYAVAMQPDGKIVVAGYSKDSANANFAVVRYNTDGSLDTSFDNDGKVTTDLGTQYDYAFSIAIQDDGKIVVAGSTGYISASDFALVRYNSDGSLDTSFDNDGIVTTGIIDNSNDYGVEMAIQNDGKIVVAGNTNSYDFVVIRYNTDGSLDPSFGTDGKVITDSNDSLDEATSMVIQPNGKIVVAGVSNDGTGEDFAIVRYNDNGSLDTSFDIDGKVVTQMGTTDSRIESVVIDSNSKIVVAGIADNNDIALARYNLDGSLDTSLDDDGKVITTFSNDSVFSTAAVKIQVDGKILVAGTTYIIDSYGNFGVTRYNSDGSLDTTFDADGRVVTDFISNRIDNGWAMAIQNDNKIVIAGASYTNAFKNNFSLARYNNSILGTTEMFQDNVSIFPNPTSNTITIKSNQQPFDNALITVTNILGGIVLKKTNQSNTEINLEISSQPAGIYFLTIENQGRKVMEKIIKS